MQTVTTIGLDIAKSVFQVHGVDAEGKVLNPARSTQPRRQTDAIVSRSPAFKTGGGANGDPRFFQPLRATWRCL